MTRELGSFRGVYQFCRVRLDYLFCRPPFRYGGQALGNSEVGCRVEKKANVRATDFYVEAWVTCAAVPPVDDPILTRVNRILRY